MNKDTAYVGSISESLANSYLTTGKYDSAIVYYNMKLKVDPSSVSTHINKAMCLIQLKNYEEARVSLLDAIQLKNDNLTSHKYLAMTYRLMDSLEAATAEYKDIIKLAEVDVDKNKNELSEAYGFFGYSDLVKKRYPSAIENLKKAINYTPDNIQYHVWLAQAYALGSRTEDAIREYKKVLQMDPRNADAKKGLKILGE
jgi:tetratricopeptide (TPR) repeat protein